MTKGGGLLQEEESFHQRGMEWEGRSLKIPERGGTRPCSVEEKGPAEKFLGGNRE